MSRGDRATLPRTDTLYVGGLVPHVDEAELRDAFVGFGRIASVHIPRDKASSRSKGYGFVTFADYDDAADALVSNRRVFVGGKTVKIGPGKSRNVRDDGGGGHRTPPPPGKRARSPSPLAASAAEALGLAGDRSPSPREDDYPPALRAENLALKELSERVYVLEDLLMRSRQATAASERTCADLQQRISEARTEYDDASVWLRRAAAAHLRVSGAKAEAVASEHALDLMAAALGSSGGAGARASAGPEARAQQAPPLAPVQAPASHAYVPASRATPTASDYHSPPAARYHAPPLPSGTPPSSAQRPWRDSPEPSEV